DLQAASLPDREMDDAIMPTQHATIEIDNVARFGCARLETFDHLSIAPRRHKADVLTVVLVGDGEPELARELARFALGPITKRKPQDVELLMRRAEQEIALITFVLARAIKRTAAIRPLAGCYVMTCRKHSCAEFSRSAKQIVKLDRDIAIDAGHRRLA